MSYSKLDVILWRFLAMPSMVETVVTSMLSLVLLPFITSADVDTDKIICVTDGCVMSAASVLANMDKSASPCDDFYEFACGKFTRDAKVDDDKTSRTTYSAVNDMLVNKVRRMLEDPRSELQTWHSTLAKRLYEMCMNERKLENRGIKPLLDLIAAVGGWPVLSGDQWDATKFQWTDGVYRFRELGLNIDYLVDLSIKVNHMNTSEYIIEVDRGRLAFNSLYLKSGMEDSKVKNYYRYMVDLAVMLGAPRNRAEAELRDSLEFEVLLAKISQVYYFMCYRIAYIYCCTWLLLTLVLFD